MAKKKYDNAVSRGDLWRMRPEDVVIIGLDTDDGHEHGDYDSRIHLPLKEEMVLNIMALGVGQPISIKKRGDDPIVIDGRQRVRHAREANKRLRARGEPEILLDCKDHRGDDLQLELTSIGLNELREDDPTLVKAEKAARMIQRGHAIDAVAMAFGVTKQTVRNWLELDELAPEVKQRIHDGDISPTAAAQFTGLKPEAQREAVEQLVKDTGNKKPTVSAAKAAKARATGEKATKARGKRYFNKVLKAAGDVDRPAPYDDGVLDGIRLALGMVDPSDERFDGIRDLLKAGE